jgi:hypothetical protein
MERFGRMAIAVVVGFFLVMAICIPAFAGIEGVRPGHVWTKAELIRDTNRILSGQTAYVLAAYQLEKLRGYVDQGKITWKELKTSDSELTNAVRQAQANDAKSALDELRDGQSVSLMTIYLAEGIRRAVLNGAITWQELGVTEQSLEKFVQKTKVILDTKPLKEGESLAINGFIVHKVAQGQTLSGICYEHFHDGTRPVYMAVAKEIGIETNPDLVLPGEVLIFPLTVKK